MKPGSRRLMLSGFALLIVTVGLVVLVPYFQEQQREYERIRRVAISESARDLPEIAVQLMTDNVGIDTPYTITSAQRTPNPEGFFKGESSSGEYWCITVEPAVDFLFGPQKNYIALFGGPKTASVTFIYDSDWSLYPFRIDESIFEAIGCTWAD